METVIATRSAPNGRIDILQTERLAGSSDIRAAEQMFFANEAGIRLKRVRITLQGEKAKARIEPGALHHMHGNLEMKASTGGGIARGLLRRVTSGENFFVNEIHGQGEIYLEPTFGHFMLVEIENDSIVVDRSLFYGGLGDLVIGARRNSAVTAILGHDGWFQTEVKGTGIVILCSPVPEAELQEVTLNNETLSVDGNFAIMRTGDISYSVKKSSRSWVATSVSKEGLLQTFTGTGTVWLAPTQDVYEKLSTPSGLEFLSRPPGERGYEEDVHE